jgi:hypothetical protein
MVPGEQPTVVVVGLAQVQVPGSVKEGNSLPVCGPDRDRHLGQIREFAEAGYDHVFVHQVGSDREGLPVLR